MEPEIFFGRPGSFFFKKRDHRNFPFKKRDDRNLSTKGIL